MAVILYYLLRWSGLILLGLLIYAQTFQFDFVFDDHIFVVANPFIKNFSNIHLMWHAFPMTRLIGMYSFAFNYYFNQLNPQGYHIFNFTVHLLAVGLVWALADLLFKITEPVFSESRLTKELPLIIAVIFLVHPCQTQAVTYISQRFESMATVFYLGAVYTYLRARLSTHRIHAIMLWGLSVVLTILGVMTKEVGITVPAMILVSEWILFPKKNDKSLYLVLVAGGLVLYLLFSKMVHAGLNVFLQTYHSESHDGDVLTPMRYVLTQMRVFLTFCRLLVLPVHQNLDYDYPASSGFLHPPLTLVGAVVILGIISLVIKLRRHFPLIAFGLAWMLITFSVNVVPRSNVIFEHKLYLISFGFFLVFVAVMSILVRNPGTLFRILCCVIVALAVLSFQRNKIWANELTLWQNSIKNSPDKARVNGNLGRVYGSLGRYDEAIDYLSRSIALNPDNIAYENRGIMYAAEGKNVQALEDFNKSIAMDPDYATVYVKRSWLYQTQHQDEAALADLAHAIKLEPYFPDAYLERGMLWVQLGKNKEALNDFQRVLSIDPFNTDAERYKSYCLTKMGFNK